MALAANALTTVATVEDELGISSGTEDARLQRMINMASAMAESHAGRTFYRDTAIEEKVRASEGPYLVLARAPVHSVTSIAYLGTTLSSNDYEVYRDGKSGLLYAITGSWGRGKLYYQDVSRTPVHGQERAAYTVTYDGGWYTQAQDDADGDITRDLPYDIEYAVVAIVAYLRRSMGRDPSVTAESLLGSSVRYGALRGSGGGASGLRDIVPMAADTLDSYKIPVLR